MLAGALLSGALLGVLAVVLKRWCGPVSAVALAGFVWWLVVIALVTLVPLTGVDLAIPAEVRSDTCSMDYGGPAPDGFWILGGTQRTLNTVLFVPAGALLVLAAARWRSRWVVVPLGAVALAAYSVAIETTQLAVARIGRACDVTDIADNVLGIGVGVAVGVGLALALRPWRWRPAPHEGHH